VLNRRCKKYLKAAWTLRSAWELLVGLCVVLYYDGWDMLTAQFEPPPKGRTLQERYPAAPGAFVTSYSSIELGDKWFVPRPRRFVDRDALPEEAMKTSEREWELINRETGSGRRVVSETHSLTFGRGLLIRTVYYGVMDQGETMGVALVYVPHETASRA
jgi:hypothetical protein